MSSAPNPRRQIDDPLLSAVLDIGAGLELPVVLRRIVEAAVELVNARFGALGVVGEDGLLSEFITVGVDEPTAELIGALPRGKGLLGVLLEHPMPLRVQDLATHPASHGLPPGHPPMHSFLGVPIRIREQVFGNLYLTEKRDHGVFDEEDESVVLALAAAAGVAIENARLYDALGQRERWIRASGELSSALLSGTPSQDALQSVVDSACDVAGAGGALVVSPGPSGEPPVVRARAGVLTPPVSATALAELPTPAVLLRGERARAALLDDRVTWAVLVPLGEQGSVLAVAGDGAHVPADQLPAELEAYAVRAALALELAERRGDAERVAVLEDRDRIARDLHDLVIQRLFATGMRLQGLARALPGEEDRERLHVSIEDLDTTITEIRTAIHALQRPTGAGLTGLRAQLLDELDAGAERLGFAPAFRLDADLDTAVDERVGAHLVAVLREALSNVARHASAREVGVSVMLSRGLVVLHVRDDGRGLPEQLTRRGLANLAHRADLVSGSFEIGPAAEGGTVLRWTASARIGT